jgi:anthranilate phosphoribosyltransferase
MNNSILNAETLEKLFEGTHLSISEARALILQIVNGEISAAQQAAILTIFCMRKISLPELIGFREGLFSLASRVDLSDHDAIDVCGTGGDGKSSYNISTAVAFVLAGAGIKVAKHGNHGVSSSCGSSTVLEQLGVTFSADQSLLNRQLEIAGVCFLHAPLFHPALKSIAGIRKELGFRTFFNILGPLLNPAAVKTQLIGVYSLELARLLKYYFQQQDSSVAVVHSLDGYDEVSLAAPTHILGVLNDSVVNAHDFALAAAHFEKSAVKTGVKENATALLALLENRGSREYRDMVLANSAVALKLKFPQSSLPELVVRAAESLDSGRAKDALTRLLSL